MIKKKDIKSSGPNGATEKRLSSIKERFSFRFFSAKDASLWNSEKKRIVVIGSGIGGMASGALFAKIGHDVKVLEMNPAHIGGHGRWLTIQGMKYSMGPQYVWEFGEGEIGSRFLQCLGLKSSNPFLLMKKDGFERIFIGNRDEEANSYFLNFKVPLGLEKFRDAMIALFPEERDNLNSLFEDMIGIYTAYISFFTENTDIEGRIFLATKFFLTGEAPFSLKLKLGQTIFLSLQEWFDRHRISSLPRRILYAHGGIFAESESEMSAIAYIIGTGDYHKGARYPQKGFHHLFESLADSIRENGGSVETGKKAVRIEVLNHLAVGVICGDGSEYPCDFVFSDISPRLTYNLMGKDASHFEYNPSHCVPTVCIGLAGGLDSVARMKGSNYWWQDGDAVDYDNPDVTKSPRMLYICSPTANGYSGLTGNDRDALVVFCPGNYRQEKAIYEKGNEAVEKFKKNLVEDIVSILDRNVFPGLRSKLLFAEAISSVDIQGETDGEMGNAYGRRMNVKEILKGQIEEEGCPKNLYNVSATKNTPGIAGGISTAIKLFQELTGKKI